MSKKEETVFKERIMPQLKKLGYFVKIQQVAVSGTPDIIGTINGVFIAIELKTNTGKLSQLQKLNLYKIAKAGGVSLEVSPKNWESIYAFLLTLRRNYRVKKFRKYLLKSLLDHGQETDKSKSGK